MTQILLLISVGFCVYWLLIGMYGGAIGAGIVAGLVLLMWWLEW